MIQSHTEMVSKSETVIDDVICNSCGKSIIEINQNSDYLHIEKDWGYFSPFDNENYRCDICPDCCLKIVSTFKIPITK